MEVIRVEVFTVLGVRFSPTTDIETMKSTLKEGADNIVNDIPELYQDLQEDLQELDELISLRQELKDTELNVQELLKQISNLKEKRIDQLSENWRITAKIVGIIGNMGGTQPPYPTAQIELNTVELALTQIEQEIKAKQLEIDEKNSYISQQIEQIALRKKSVGDSVMKKISQHLSTIYNTDKEQYIY